MELYESRYHDGGVRNCDTAGKRREVSFATKSFFKKNTVNVVYEKQETGQGKDVARAGE